MSDATTTEPLEAVHFAEPASSPDEVKAEVDALDIGEAPTTEEERLLYRVTKRRFQIASEIQRVKDQTAAMVRDLESKLAGLEYVYDALAADATRKLLVARGGKVKSIKTPWGTAGFRKEADKLEIVDADKLMEAAATTQGMEAVIVIEPTISKSKLNEWVKTTGEIPAGTEMKPGGEKFYIR